MFSVCWWNGNTQFLSFVFLHTVATVCVISLCMESCTRIYTVVTICVVPSVLWRCWLGGRKGIRPVKNRVVGYWHCYLSGARCRLAYGPADASATHCLLLHLNPYLFCLLVPAHLGSPRQRAVKRVCVCVIMVMTVWSCEYAFVRFSISEWY